MDKKAYNPGKPSFRVVTPTKVKNNVVKDELQIKIGREDKMHSIDMHQNENSKFTSKQNQDRV